MIYIVQSVSTRGILGYDFYATNLYHPVAISPATTGTTPYEVLRFSFDESLEEVKAESGSRILSNCTSWRREHIENPLEMKLASKGPCHVSIITFF